MASLVPLSWQTRALPSITLQISADSQKPISFKRRHAGELAFTLTTRRRSPQRAFESGKTQGDPRTAWVDELGMWDFWKHIEIHSQKQGKIPQHCELGPTKPKSRLNKFLRRISAGFICPAQTSRIVNLR
jgi:hypothetical protein